MIYDHSLAIVMGSVYEHLRSVVQVQLIPHRSFTSHAVRQDG